MQPSKELRVDVWSDIACPWCYIGKRRLESALAKLPAGSVHVVWRSFELDPSAPRERDDGLSQAERLAKKYGMTAARATQMMAHVTELARADGLDLHLDGVHSTNTFDAHRVLHLARLRGKQAAAKERFMRAYMTESERLGDPETLVRLGAEAGLDQDEVRSALTSGAYADDVRADEEEAREIGINGVPFFVIGGKVAVSGAQPASTLLSAIESAREELEPAPMAEGAACGPEGRA